MLWFCCLADEVHEHPQVVCSVITPMSGVLDLCCMRVLIVCCVQVRAFAAQHGLDYELKAFKVARLPRHMLTNERQWDASKVVILPLDITDERVAAGGRFSGEPGWPPCHKSKCKGGLQWAVSGLQWTVSVGLQWAVSGLRLGAGQSKYQAAATHYCRWQNDACAAHLGPHKLLCHCRHQVDGATPYWWQPQEPPQGHRHNARGQEEAVHHRGRGLAAAAGVWFGRLNRHAQKWWLCFDVQRHTCAHHC
jgi:hypothetical protein